MSTLDIVCDTIAETPVNFPFLTNLLPPNYSQEEAYGWFAKEHIRAVMHICWKSLGRKVIPFKPVNNGLFGFEARKGGHSVYRIADTVIKKVAGVRRSVPVRHFTTLDVLVKTDDVLALIDVRIINGVAQLNRYAEHFARARDVLHTQAENNALVAVFPYGTENTYTDFAWKRMEGARIVELPLDAWTFLYCVDANRCKQNV